MGLPVVLKTDGTSGGLGVKVVDSETEAVRVFGILNAPPQFLRAAKRAAITMHEVRAAVGLE